MRLWRKAKLLGVWDPESFSLRQDAEDWRQLSELEQEVLLHLSALFLAGEQAVVHDLMPLMRVISKEGRLEEEIYLTSFLWEEAKHVEGFSRFLSEVAGATHSDLTRFHGPAYRRLFYEELPAALDRLDTDQSPQAVAEASVTYNMIVEGVMAESGYFGYHKSLKEHGLMPGMQEMILHVKRDESRHIGYGVFLLARLVAEHGDSVWTAIENRMNSLVALALEVIQETLNLYETLPFGLTVDDFVGYAMDQFQRRMQRISRAKEQTLDEVLEAVDIETAEA